MKKSLALGAIIAIPSLAFAGTGLVRSVATAPTATTSAAQPALDDPTIVAIFDAAIPADGLPEGECARLEKLVAAKERKKQDIVRTPEEEGGEEEAGGEVVDLLAILSKSLGAGGTRKPARKRAPAKKRKKAS